MKRYYSDYIADILDSIIDIEAFIKDLIYEEFIIDKKTTNAVIRSLEVMGEAAKKIPEDIRYNNPEIPWKFMAGMRDKLVHEYFGVDLEIVWTVAIEEIPPLKAHLQELLTELENLEN